MAGAMAGLFVPSLRAPLSAEAAAGVRLEIGIWLILATSGPLSALLSRVAPVLAPWVYSLIPVANFLFVRRHNRSRKNASEAPPPA